MQVSCLMGGKDMAGKIDNRGRVWATIVYVESAPDNFRDIIERWHIPALLSPVHNMDKKDDGELKKEHYHLMVWFEGKKSKDQVIDLFREVGGVGCEKVSSKIGMARYLCHLDNKDKASYNPEDVIEFCGADYYFLITSEVDRLSVLKEMENWVDNNDILYYNILSKYARDNRPDWYRVLTKSATIHMTQYLKSRSYQIKEDQKRAYESRI